MAKKEKKESQKKKRASVPVGEEQGRKSGYRRTNEEIGQTELYRGRFLGTVFGVHTGLSDVLLISPQPRISATRHLRLYIAEWCLDFDARQGT